MWLKWVKLFLTYLFKLKTFNTKNLGFMGYYFFISYFVGKSNLTKKINKQNEQTIQSVMGWI